MDRSVPSASHCLLSRDHLIHSFTLLYHHVSHTRPIAGHANLCPDSISTKSQDLETLLSTVKHEILHALGFSVSLYSYFRDKDGRPLTPRGRNGKPRTKDISGGLFLGDGVIKRFIRHEWKVRGGTVKKEVNMIVTPRVVVSIVLGPSHCLQSVTPLTI